MFKLPDIFLLLLLVMVDVLPKICDKKKEFTISITTTANNIQKQIMLIMSMTICHPVTTSNVERPNASIFFVFITH